MKKSLASLVFAALGVLLLTGTNAWAQPIQWSFTASPIADLSGTPYTGGLLPSNTPLWSGPPLSSIKFTPSFGNVAGSTGIIIYNMQTQSVAGSGANGPDSFNNVDFLATFTVSDTKTLSTGTITFHGQYNATNVTAGSLTKGTINWINDRGNTDPLGKSNPLGTEASIVLGSGADLRTYDFNINPGDFLSSLAPNGGLGSFAVEATVTDGGVSGSGGETQPSATPEPASLALAGFGFPLVVLLRRRLKKSKSEAAVA